MKKISLIKNKKYVIYVKKDLVMMKYHKVKDHCHYTGKYRGPAHSICNLRYQTPKEIQIVLHNGSTYDYHFIIKQLEKEFGGQSECLGENTEKYITFSVPIKKELGHGKAITYKLKFIDNFRFMPTSLSKLVDNLSEIYSKNVQIKTVNLSVSLKGLKITNFLIIAQGVKKKQSKTINGLIKKLPNI